MTHAHAAAARSIRNAVERSRCHNIRFIDLRKMLVAFRMAKSSFSAMQVESINRGFTSMNKVGTLEGSNQKICEQFAEKSGSGD